MSGAYETLEITVAGHVAVLTLSREARHNAISSRMNVELPVAWRQLEDDPAIRVVVVTGAGVKAFCTGADLADLPRTEDPEFAQQLASIGWTGRQCGVTKPVIAAINGLTVGAGLHYAADSDIVLAADHARFVDSHVAVGLIAALEPVSLVRRIPLGAVMKLALTGGDEKMTAQEAYRIGMVDEIMPLDQLMPRAMELAASIARHSPTAVARTRASIWAAKEMGLGDALEKGWHYILAQTQHPDVEEGVAAFLEKRPPAWRDREPGDLD
ncbi:enoyl-CoA hydratase [Croceicoccus estronivorus]|uniref:enoyl-CoA hydratase/isomerase family protein n=1 Tax=Croceicoccus estronivorus TaxID=1172626 RepID=UPI000829ED8B|nr:enoyl-CoA hydratase-related protein [Croceicoccus estronivorus]OCC25142.1 enoyl-CoA hydratase [Croceicoccus estronivorus]